MNTNTGKTSFEKILSANDTGITGGHMGGIHIPRTEAGLLAILPKLDPKQYNPSVFITVQDANGDFYKLRFVYYNNKLHKMGTRNEYRLTYLTGFLCNSNAKPGDAFRITLDESGCFEMEVIHKTEVKVSSVIRLRGWNRIC